LTPDVSFVRDRLGRLTSITYGSGIRALAYDAQSLALATARGGPRPPGAVGCGDGAWGERRCSEIGVFLQYFLSMPDHHVGVGRGLFIELLIADDRLCGDGNTLTTLSLNVQLYV
jgi:YD repeat-containing protein